MTKQNNIKVYRPVHSNVLTQYFAQNLACIKTDITGKAIEPRKIIGTKTGVCPVGYKPLYKQEFNMKGHNGWDNATYRGEYGYFPVDATGITWTAKNYLDFNGGIGLDVISDQYIHFAVFPKDIIMGDMQMAKREWNENGHSLRLKFRFWHLKKSFVADGQKVMFGQRTFACDNTGDSSGDHLHWSPKVVDKNGWTIDGDNGYYGAFDFKDWYEDVFVLDVLKVKAQGLTAIQLARKVVFEVMKFISNRK